MVHALRWTRKTTGKTSKTMRRKKAQGMVEFALVLPILLLAIFGIIDFGWMI